MLFWSQSELPRRIDTACEVAIGAFRAIVSSPPARNAWLLLLARTHIAASTRAMPLRGGANHRSELFGGTAWQKQSIKGRPPMRKLALFVILLSFAGMVPSSESFAQSALRGAVIGGAVGGRRGAAIGATAGAIAGAHRRHQHWHRYYWRNGNCWYRSTSGRSHRVSHRYCR